MPISDHIKKQIIELYATDISIAEIHRQTKVSEPTITKILKTAGIEIRRKNYQRLDINIESVNELYNSGKSTYEISKLLECSDETIRKMIINQRPESDRNKRSDSSKLKIGIASKKNWQNKEYIDKVATATKTDDYIKRLKESGKKNYESSLGAWMRTAESKLIISKAIKEKWNDENYLQKQKIWFGVRAKLMSEAAYLSLQDPRKRKKWIDKIRINSTNNIESRGWVSTSQKQLYYILSISGIEYYEEGSDTRIGPFYVVDCVIPQQQNMSKPLIIEVQGEYWHSLQHTIIKDKQKATYIRNHTNFDLLALDDLNLASLSDIESKLINYGISIKKDICTTKELEIKQINESEASLFYSIFHYSGSIRKGAITYGAFLGDELVAAISYCYPIRTETATKLGYQLHEVLEISRLSRRTNILCDNLASYLIAKTRKLTPKDIKCIVSFSDSAYGHNGTVYKAAGFVNSGITSNDYHYISMTGKYHKKTIWDRAKKMRISEDDYAKKHNLLKITTSPKTRWIWTKH